MFNKEESNNKSLLVFNSKIPLKKIGAFVVTVSLLVEGLNISKAEELSYEGGEENLYNYEQQVLYNYENKSYDKKLIDLYNNGNYRINNKIYSIGNVYLAYGYTSEKKVVFYLVCPKLGNYNFLNNESYNLSDINLIRLCDTTLFIELLKEKLLTYDEKNNLSFDESRVSMINEMVNNWDGKLHNLVPELDIDDMDMVIYEKR